MKKITGVQTSLKTKDRHEAQRTLQARDDTENQPHLNLALARVSTNVYLRVQCQDAPYLWRIHNHALLLAARAR